MTAGRFYIDGRDAYEQYRVFLAEGSVASLLQYPSLKKVDSTDWPEEDGEEVDLTTPRLDTRNVSLKFVSHDAGGRFGEYGDFVTALSDMGYHDFYFPFMERTFHLRLTSHPSMEHWRRADFFTLQFADDFPPCCTVDIDEDTGEELEEDEKEKYTRPEPRSTITPYDDYELDGRKLAYYGVRVLQGSLAEVLKSPAVKGNLLINAGTRNGAWYDKEWVKFKSKEVKLNCLMRAATFEEFWRCYEAFLYDLARPDGEVKWTAEDIMQPGERLLFVDATSSEYPCYYKSCASKGFAFTEGKIWWEFTLTLVFTSFRVGADEFYLAAEHGAFIITESDDRLIDMGTEKQ